MQWEIILTHRAGHQMSFIRWHEKRPNAEQAYDLVAEHFDVDLDDSPEPQINELGWKLTGVFQVQE